jgi:hypothetical protein
MPPNKVNLTNIYSVWQKINNPRAKSPQGRVKLKVGDLVRITKEKVKFAKGHEQNFSREIFRIVRIIQRAPQPFYELPDL